MIATNVSAATAPLPGSIPGATSTAIPSDSSPALTFPGAGVLGYTPAPVKMAGNPSFTDTMTGLAQGGWQEIFEPFVAVGDFFDFAASNPTGALGLSTGGIVGGLQTIRDLAKGLRDLTGHGAEILAIPEEKIPQLFDQAGKVCSYLSQHGSEVPARVVASLRQEINEIAALYNKGDPVSLWNAGRKAGHLASSIFAAVEGGASGGKALLAKAGKALSQVRTTETIVDILKDLTPKQTPPAVKLAHHLFNNPQDAARVPAVVIGALREGLELNLDQPGARSALRLLDEMEHPGQTQLGASRVPVHGQQSMQDLIRSIDFGKRPAGEIAALRQAVVRRVQGMTLSQAKHYLRNLASSPGSQAGLAHTAANILYSNSAHAGRIARSTSTSGFVDELVRRLSVKDDDARRVSAFKKALTEYLLGHKYNDQDALRFIENLPHSPALLKKLAGLAEKQLTTQQPARGAASLSPARPATPSTSAIFPALDFDQQWLVKLPDRVNHAVPFNPGTDGKVPVTSGAPVGPAPAIIDVGAAPPLTPPTRNMNDKPVAPKGGAGDSGGAADLNKAGTKALGPDAVVAGRDEQYAANAANAVKNAEFEKWASQRPAFRRAEQLQERQQQQQAGQQRRQTEQAQSPSQQQPQQGPARRVNDSPMEKPSAEQSAVSSPWSEHYEIIKDNQPANQLIDALLDLARSGKPPGLAVDLGAGAGLQTAALAGAGWSVIAVDADPASTPYVGRSLRRTADRIRSRGDDPTALMGQVVTAQTPFSEFRFPRDNTTDLVYSASLSFVPQAEVRPLVDRARQSLKTGGRLVISLFGPTHELKDRPGVTTWSEPEVRSLLKDFDIVSLSRRTGETKFRDGKTGTQDLIELTAVKRKNADDQR